MIGNFGRIYKDLRIDEIEEIITDIFHPNKIQEIIKTEDGFCIKMLANYQYFDDNIGDFAEHEESDTVCIFDPWEYGVEPSEIMTLNNDAIGWEEIVKLRKYCFAHGVCPYAKDNPYIIDE